MHINIVSEAESVPVKLQTLNNSSFEVAASDVEALQNVDMINSNIIISAH